MLTSIVDIGLEPIEGGIEGADDEVALLHIVNRPRLISAVGNEILQLHAAALGNVMLPECGI
jgi:hypothetical protein